MSNTGFLEELLSWMRHNKWQIKKKGDDLSTKFSKNLLCPMCWENESVNQTLSNKKTLILQEGNTIHPRSLCRDAMQSPRTAQEWHSNFSPEIIRKRETILLDKLVSKNNQKKGSQKLLNWDITAQQLHLRFGDRMPLDM